MEVTLCDRCKAELPKPDRTLKTYPELVNGKLMLVIVPVSHERKINLQENIDIPDMCDGCVTSFNLWWKMNNP